MKGNIKRGQNKFLLILLTLVFLCLLSLPGTVFAEGDEILQNGSIVINEGSEYTRSRTVMLTLAAPGTMSKIVKAEISNDGKKWEEIGWSEYNSIDIQWLLSKGDGLKTVHVRFTDETGKVYKTVSDSIELRTSDLDMEIDIALKYSTQDKTTLNISVETSYSDGLLYQIWGNGANGWEVLKSYNDPYDKNTGWDWDVSNINSNLYEVHARVKDKVTGVVCGQKTVMVSDDDMGRIRIDGISTNLGKGELGKPVTIIAATGGGIVLQYEFIISDGDAIVEKSTIESNSYIWTPDKTGNYNITVRITGKDSQSDEAAIPFLVTNQNYKYPEINRLEISGGGKETVSIKPYYENNIETWEHSFGIGESMRGSTIKTAYVLNTPQDEYVWDPWSNNPAERLGSGIYEIWAHVRDKAAVKYDDDVRGYVTVDNPNGPITLNINAYDITLNDAPKELKSNSIILAGTQVQITATSYYASDPDRNLEYSFWLLDERGYRLVRDYGSGNIYEWTGHKSGIYTLLVRVREKGVSGSYEDQKSITLKVVDPNHPEIDNIKIEAININTPYKSAIKKHTEVELEIKASGTDNLMYYFAVTDKLYGWKTLRTFSPDNTCTWIPKKPGDYTIVVWVKDQVSGSLEKTAQKEVQVTDQEPV